MLTQCLVGSNPTAICNGMTCTIERFVTVEMECKVMKLWVASAIPPNKFGMKRNSNAKKTCNHIALRTMSAMIICAWNQLQLVTSMDVNFVFG